MFLGHLAPKFTHTLFHTKISIFHKYQCDFLNPTTHINFFTLFDQKHPPPFPYKQVYKEITYKFLYETLKSEFEKITFFEILKF